MTDRLHWHYVSIVFVFVLTGGVLIDTWPLYQTCQRYKGEEKMLVSQLLDFQQQSRMSVSARGQVSTSSVGVVSEHAQLLKMMAEIAHVTGAHLISINQIPFENEEGLFGDRAKCMFNGTYQEMVDVMMRLHKTSNGILTRDFSLKRTDQGDFLLLVDVSLLNMAGIPHPSVLAEMRDDITMTLKNPFCLGDGGLSKVEANIQARVHSVPVNLLQMAGYLRQGKRVAAWIRLPEGDIVQLKQGDVIGREQASVTQIKQHQITLIAPTRLIMYISAARGEHD